MKKIAAALLRVSTTQQELESQKDDIKKEANKYGYEIPEEYFFGEQISGGKPQFIKEIDKDGNETGYLIAQEDSKSLESLKEVCQNPKTSTEISAIFVWEISRISRCTALLLTQVNFFNILKKPIYFISERLWTLDSITKEINPQAQMVLPHLAMYAEQEYQKIKERMQRGLRYAFEKDKDRYVGGQIPYGFKVIKPENGKKGYLVADEFEKSVIDDIFDKYINHGWSFKKIRDYLNSKNIPTRKGKLWVDSNIARIINNKRLIGERKRSDMTTESTPLVNIDLYNQAQEVLNDKKLIYGRRERTYNYILKPYIKCSCCNRVLQGVVCSSRKLYYCKDCNITVNKFRADAIVWNTIKDSDQLHFHLIESKFEEKDYTKQINELNEFIKLNNIQIEDLKKTRSGLISLYKKKLYTLEEVEEETIKIDKDIININKDIKDYQKQLQLIQDEINTPKINSLELDKMIQEASGDFDKIKNLFKILLKDVLIYNPSKKWIIIQIVFKNNTKVHSILNRDSKLNNYIELSGFNFKYQPDTNDFLSFDNQNQTSETHTIESFIGSTLEKKFQFIETDPYTNDNPKVKQKRDKEYEMRKRAKARWKEKQKALKNK